MLAHAGTARRMGGCPRESATAPGLRRLGVARATLPLSSSLSLRLPLPLTRALSQPTPPEP